MTGRDNTVSGASALAQGAIESGVSLVTGYPGSPTTAVVDQLVAMTSPDKVRVEWTSNEKVAIEMAYGGSLGGSRSLLCVKSVGLNVALDPLMAFNLSGCNAGLVLLAGDDPGAWGSQNEQDSRALALAVDMPVLEPTSVADARAAMVEAYQLSEGMGMPVMVRITRALAYAEGALNRVVVPETAPPPFVREPMRWLVLPVNVVSYHSRLLERLEAVRARFESSILNGEEGSGALGVVACGATYQKLLSALGGTVSPMLRVLRLGTFYPLPEQRLVAFLDAVASALVLEETAPLVERAVRATAQRRGLALPIHGRDTGHVDRVGEVFPLHIAVALNTLLPALGLPTAGETSRPMPSRWPLCDGCPYIPIFEVLLGAIEGLGGRDRAVIVGDPGCMVRAQLPPYELLDVKYSLGSSIGTAAGIALGQRAYPEEARRVVALCGDSSFLHTGLNGLVDAARVGVPLLVIVLDNGTTALSGGQPHPGNPVDVRGSARPSVDLAALAHAAGAERTRVVDTDRGEDARAILDAGLRAEGVTVVIARGQCPRWEAEQA